VFDIESLDTRNKNYEKKMASGCEICIFFLAVGLLLTFIQMTTMDAHVKYLEKQMVYFVPMEDVSQLVYTLVEKRNDF
jgi:hypothetical protein